MKLRYGTAAPEGTTLNLTSMIDCVFLLLIFFVATLKAPKLEANIHAYLPKTPPEVKATGAAPEQKKPEANTVHILLRKGSGGAVDVFFNGAPLEGGFNRLNGALASLRHITKDTPGAKTEIVLDAEPIVPYRHVVTVLDLCSKYQFASVSFAMPAKEGGKTP